MIGTDDTEYTALRNGPVPNMKKFIATKRPNKP